MTPGALVPSFQAAVAMVAGLGPLELVIILMVALMGLVVPVMVLWFVFVAGRRKGVQDAENRGRPAD